MKQNKQKDTYTVFSLRVAGKLCKKGFHMVGTRPDKNKPWLNVYDFKYSPELVQAIEEVKYQK